MTDDDKKALGVGCLLGAALAVVVCGALGAYVLRVQHSRWEDETVRRGAAQFDPTTGDWEWKPAKAGE